MTKRNPLEQKVSVELTLGEWMSVHDILHERVVSEFKSAEQLKDTLKRIDDLDAHELMLVVGAKASLNIHEIINTKVNEAYNDKIAKA